MRSISIIAALCLAVAASAVELPTHDQVRTALQAVVAEGDGFGLHMWATVVDRDGVVVVVCHSGEDRGDQWPGSRVISAQKANTANAFSLPGLALSTANLYTAVQPGGTLYGLQHSNPVNTDAAYGGKSADIGTAKDPMVGEKIGGVNVFGGGLPLYAADGTLLGAIGLSGDTSVADHIKAWKLRDALGLDHVPGGVGPDGTDNIALDITDGVSAGGWGHPATTNESTTVAKALPASHPVGDAAP